MAIVIENLTVNETIYKHIYSDKGFYIKRDDNKLFIDVLQTTSDTHTYTETSQVAAASLTSRLSSLENKHNTLQGQHDALQALPHITETYVNGTSWYRIYSDKWLEQGGYCSSSTQTVKYLKSFKNTNYTLVGGLIQGTPSTTYEHLNMGSQTVNGFTYTSYDGYSLKWFACGNI